MFFEVADFREKMAEKTPLLAELSNHHGYITYTSQTLSQNLTQINNRSRFRERLFLTDLKTHQKVQQRLCLVPADVASMLG